MDVMGCVNWGQIPINRKHVDLRRSVPLGPTVFCAFVRWAGYRSAGPLWRWVAGTNGLGFMGFGLLQGVHEPTWFSRGGGCVVFS